MPTGKHTPLQSNHPSHRDPSSTQTPVTHTDTYLSRQSFTHILPPSHPTHKPKPSLGIIIGSTLKPRCGMQSQALTPFKLTLWKPINLIHSLCQQGTSSFKPLLGNSSTVTPLSSDSIWQLPPSEVRAQRSEEHTHCKSDLTVLLAQVAQVSRDVGLQPQVLSVHSVLLEGKEEPPHFSLLSGLKGKLSDFDFGCKKVEPKEFKHFSSYPWKNCRCWS